MTIILDLGLALLMLEMIVAAPYPNNFRLVIISSGRREKASRLSAGQSAEHFTIWNSERESRCSMIRHNGGGSTAMITAIFRNALPS
jgi:hypothetical protein